VESAVIEIRKRSVKGLPNCDPDRFAQLVRLGFSSRRKQLRSLLDITLEDWEKWTQSKGHPFTARAEDLPVDHWADLAFLNSRIEIDPIEEIFDVVDGNDHVIASMNRDKVHVNNFPHRAVHLWIFNHQGDLFLQKRSPWKKNHPDLWCSSAAGHVNSGETYEAAAHRELLEEIGVKSRLVKFWKVDPSAETGHEFIEFFVGISDGPFRLAPGEVEAGAFFPIIQISQWLKRSPWDFTPAFHLVAAKFLGETESLIKLISVS
jgi:16S rRNA (adenine1518-N6/adenine1519-N6)-dimethyltransferase